MSCPSVFISYAREDESHRAELRKHLRPWQDAGQLEIWDDRAIDAGAEWHQEILQALDRAAAIVFLISADLLASDFVQETELPQALERSRKREAVIIPVVVRSCPWRQSPLGKLQALCTEEPVAESNADRAWSEVAERIAAAVATPTIEPPEPAYLDEHTRDLSRSLTDAYEREAGAVARGDDAAPLRREILALKRQMREDGLHPGDLLSGRYQLIEAIGEGGFARVWKSWDKQLRRLVAVKVLHQQYSRDRSRRQRFFRGAKQMARLVHPHIVRIFGEPERRDGVVRFFCMELAEGGDLKRAILSGTLDLAARLRIIREVGSALEEAHGEGIVHRDVKPANVLLDADIRAKLTDFDLVRAQDSTGGTRTGMLGTVVYAAPEAMERAKEAGARADVYGLGMTAVFALFGRDLPARELLRDAPGFALRLDAPEPVRKALARAVAWEPEERQGSVQELCAELAEAPEKKPRRAKPRKRSQRPTARPKPENLEELFEWIETPSDGRVDLWRKIPAGVGWIGSPHNDERPRHQVKILQPFRLAAVPVTGAQYAAFDPEHAGKKLPDLPVVGIDWRRALEFCRWLGKTFAWARGARLPLEEEWEYACRAGTETAYWSGPGEADLDRVGWYNKNSGNRLHQVGEKPANPHGLYDLHGNVGEWTASVWKSDYSKQAGGLEIDPAAEPADLAADASARRVVRGGTYLNGAGRTRAAFRDHGGPGFGHVNQGFRVLLPPVANL